MSTSLEFRQIVSAVYQSASETEETHHLERRCLDDQLHVVIERVVVSRFHSDGDVTGWQCHITLMLAPLSEKLLDEITHGQRHRRRRHGLGDSVDRFDALAKTVCTEND